MGNVTTVGIDLAKHSFSVHGIDAAGAVVLRKCVSRSRLMELLASQPPCLVGLEACSGAHEWARRRQRFGHQVKLMAPRFVAPYRKNSKNDGNDAEAICEAVSRPQMRFIPIKTPEQQAVLCLHRVRQGFIEERTATINRLRGLLAEFGFVLPQRGHETERVNCSSSCRRTLRERWGICSSTFALSTHECGSTSTRSKRTLGRIRPRSSPCSDRVSVRSPLRRLLPVWATCASSKTAGSSRLGSDSCLASTPPVANSGSDTSRAVAIRTCARSS